MARLCWARMGHFYFSLSFAALKAGCTQGSELHLLLSLLLLMPSFPPAFLDPGIPPHTSASLFSNPPFQPECIHMSFTTSFTKASSSSVHSCGWMFLELDMRNSTALSSSWFQQNTGPKLQDLAMPEEHLLFHGRCRISPFVSVSSVPSLLRHKPADRFPRQEHHLVVSTGNHGSIPWSCPSPGTLVKAKERRQGLYLVPFVILFGVRMKNKLYYLKQMVFTMLFDPTKAANKWYQTKDGFTGFLASPSPSVPPLPRFSSPQLGIASPGELKNVQISVLRPCNIWDILMLKKLFVAYLKFKFNWVSCISICYI